ncbi:OLC1v1011288C4 [Oldenlandia corymbosa var. corymbosa]|uniref:OLC1v1011288C4 n=1 Tax=Oldenlandia corymbosa var. corymbosa TaxID=529605 RepID=A0AAV1DTD4_OLDCO|nr:OLC1v1011288C4 [Oldenlandia corymbosa var. corymbosa]
MAASNVLKPVTSFPPMPETLTLRVNTAVWASSTLLSPITNRLSTCSAKILSLGFAINKTEEHIWKHINGKRFLHMLERMETGKGMPNGTEEHPEQKEGKKKKIKDVKKKKNKKEDKPVCEVISEVRDISVKDSDSEAGDDFWMPPAGERWDNDDGGDRWGSDTESGAESDGDDIEETEEVKQEAGELSSRYAILLVFDLLVSCKFA